MCHPFLFIMFILYSSQINERWNLRVRSHRGPSQNGTQTNLYAGALGVDGILVPLLGSFHSSLGYEQVRLNYADEQCNRPGAMK